MDYGFHHIMVVINHGLILAWRLDTQWFLINPTNPQHFPMFYTQDCTILLVFIDFMQNCRFAKVKTDSQWKHH